jgi:predicted permease
MSINSARAVGEDLRFAVRTLRRAPGWVAGVVLTLGLGIGLATAVFTIADALLLRPLPVRQQDRVVVLWGMTRDGRTDHFPLLLADAKEFQRRAQTLERVEFFSYGGALAVDVDLGGGIARIRRSLVSGGYFDLLGTRPLLGRALRPNDDVTGAAPVAVLSYAGWQRFFGGASNVVGRQLKLHELGVTYSVVGVMPLGLDYPRGVDFWAAVIPSSGPLGDQPIYAELNLIARLRPSSSLGDARSELTSFFERRETASSRWHLRGVARQLTEDVVGNVGPAVVAFAAAAGLLLLITCINVSNLLIVRGRGRAGEIAIRAALGAARGRIIVQLLIESALLAAAGALVGVAFAAAAVRAFVALAPAGTPRVDEIQVTASVIVGAIAIAALATLFFALAPTLVTSRAELQASLRVGSRQSGPSRRGWLGTEAMVAGQVALAVVVLAAAGLLVRSLVRLEQIDLAFDPSRVLVAELTVAHSSDIGDARKADAMVSELLPRLEALPGVRSAAPMLTPPFAEVGGVFGRMPAEGQTPNEDAANPVMDFEVVTPGFFQTLGISLVRGRLITDADRQGTLPVVVIGESVARHYWPEADPLGHRLEQGKDLYTVVGVVRDSHYRNLRDPRPAIYLPLRQSPFPVSPLTLVIATGASPADLAPAIRRAVSEAGLGMSVVSAIPLETYVAGPLSLPRLDALLLALFAGAAVSLAAVGLFGVMAAAVRQRTREIGVRIALGATPARVSGLVMGRALAIAAVGAVVGLLAALASTRALQSLLYAVSPTDPLTLAVVLLLLLLVALIAAYLPARRAQRVDPIVALRAE